jgi:hypothetical protein
MLKMPQQKLKLKQKIHKSQHNKLPNRQLMLQKIQQLHKILQKLLKIQQI